MRNSVLRICIVLIFVGVSMFLNPYPLFASERKQESKSKLSWVLKNIKEKEKSLKTFSAKFVQNKKTHLLQQPLHSEGLIYFDSSGKLLWKVTSPSPLTALLNDNLLLIRYPDLSRTKKRHLGSTDNILKKYFGIGQSINELKKQYEIQIVSNTDIAGYHLKLTPKMKAISRNIDTIEVVVNTKHWLPERIDFKGVQGDHTSLWLQFTSINQSLPPNIFSITYAEDYEPNF